MSKFVLIDHSLVQPGGHHFEYAEHAFRAAHAAGHQVVVAAHRNFKKPATWESGWESHPIFPHTLYDELGAHGSENSVESAPDLENSLHNRSHLSWLARWRTRTERLLVKRQTVGFRRALRQLFSDVSLSRGDHVFLPTASISDFFCLAEYLHGSSETQKAKWHLQFHYGPAVESGPAWECLQANFARAQRLTDGHELNLFTTTTGLSDRYRRLGVARCEMLPHHVNPFFTPDVYRSGSTPLRVLCAGCPRQEKGYQHLSRIAIDLWQDYFATGRAQLCLQAKPSWFGSNRPRWKAQWGIGEATANATSFQPVGESVGPIACSRFPLPAHEYVKMIRTADIGLFLYDTASYRHRCSGVFVEMLAAGVPVIVPANCWMAEQVNGANAWCRERFRSRSENASSLENRPSMIGLVAQNVDEIPKLVREMLDDHQHYRTHAIAYSNVWRNVHSAEATLRRLMSSESTAQSMAPAA